MTKPVEFSSFFNLLYAIKNGQREKQDDLIQTLKNFETNVNADSYLHDLGQMLIAEAIKELYIYSDSEDIEFLGSLNKNDWDELSKNNDSDLPKYLERKLIKYLDENQISKTISSRWKISKREIDRNKIKMARYVIEGVIDVLE